MHKDMRQRTCEQKEPRDDAKEVRAVILPKQRYGNGRKSQEDERRSGL